MATTDEGLLVAKLPPASSTPSPRAFRLNACSGHNVQALQPDSNV